MRIAIAGVGNCASSLLQGIDHYRSVPPEAHEAWGLMHLEMGGLRPGDIDVVAAFDVDYRKVGRPLHEAAFAPPNCTHAIADAIGKSTVVVQMGPVLDGVAPHMADFPPTQSFRPADEASRTRLNFVSTKWIAASVSQGMPNRRSASS